MKNKLVLMMRRSPEDLNAGQDAAIRDLFLGCQVTFERIDPVDYLEHAAICRKLKPDMVLLPREQPVPSLAMEEGFTHCVVSPDGTVMRLLPITPQFVPFASDKPEGDQPADVIDEEIDPRDSELVGYVDFLNLDDGMPCFNFKEHEGGDPKEMVEIRVSSDYARIAPVLVKLQEFDDNNCVAGLLSDFFLAGMRYQKNRKK